ncbi:MAG: hypothetical protein ABSF94_15370 [Steroidobacteraceae bacterium]|jgi:hypothetical protein
MNGLRANRMLAPIGCALVSLWLDGAVRGEPLDTLKDCAQHAPSDHKGLDVLANDCPQLSVALSQLGAAQWLAKDWARALDRRQLDDLGFLIERYHGVPPQGPIDASTLPDILKGLRQAELPANNSRWEAFKTWASSWLSRLDRSLGAWLERWLSRIGSATSFADLLLYGLVGIVLIAAAVVVVNELRAAGLLRRSRIRAAPCSGDPDAPIADAPPPAIGDLPLYERPAQLLRLLVRRLTEAGRLDRERALTHDELVARGVFDGVEQRAAFGAVANIAARILYGAQRPPAMEVEPVLAQGSALLAQIAATPERSP